MKIAISFAAILRVWACAECYSKADLGLEAAFGQPPMLPEIFSPPAAGIYSANWHNESQNL